MSVAETQFFEQEDGSRIAYKVFEPYNSEDMKDETPSCFTHWIVSMLFFFLGAGLIMIAFLTLLFINRKFKMVYKRTFDGFGGRLGRR